MEFPLEIPLLTFIPVLFGKMNGLVERVGLAFAKVNDVWFIQTGKLLVSCGQTLQTFVAFLFPVERVFWFSSSRKAVSSNNNIQHDQTSKWQVVGHQVCHGTNNCMV